MSYAPKMSMIYDDLPTVVSMDRHASVSQSISGNHGFQFIGFQKTTSLKPYILGKIACYLPYFP